MNNLIEAYLKKSRGTGTSAYANGPAPFVYLLSISYSFHPEPFFINQAIRPGIRRKEKSLQILIQDGTAGLRQTGPAV